MAGETSITKTGIFGMKANGKMETITTKENSITKTVY